MARNFLMLAASLACCVSTAWAGSDTMPPPASARPVFGPLNAAQLAQIQELGRVVLVAKQGQTNNADDAALKKDIEALPQDFDRAMAVNLATPPVLRRLNNGNSSKAQRVVAANLKLTPQTFKVVPDKDGHFQGQEAVVEPTEASTEPVFMPSPAVQGVPVAGSDPYAGVRQRLDKIEARLQQYVAGAQAQGKPERAAYGQALSDTIAQLKTELQNALADTSSNATSRIMALRERLRPQGLAAQSIAANFDGARGEATSPTPTLTTLTHHR